MEAKLLKGELKSEASYERWFKKFEPIADAYYSMLDAHMGKIM
jgi:hypothetical protein